MLLEIQHRMDFIFPYSLSSHAHFNYTEWIIILIIIFPGLRITSGEGGLKWLKGRDTSRNTACLRRQIYIVETCLFS